MSNVLFAPTTQSERNLRNEQVQGRIFMVGNTIVDAVELCMQLMSIKYCYNHSDKESILNKINLKINPAKCVFLHTLHREENVDNRDSLKQILSCIG